MPICKDKLAAAMRAEGMDDEQLTAKLAELGYEVNAIIVRRWRKALQPPKDRIPLISEALGGRNVEQDPPKRRNYGNGKDARRLADIL